MWVFQFECIFEIEKFLTNEDFFTFIHSFIQILKERYQNRNVVLPLIHLRTFKNKQQIKNTKVTYNEIIT